MKTLLLQSEELIQQASAKRAEANALVSKGTLTADEEKRFTELTNEAKGFEDQAKVKRELHERAQENEQTLRSHLAPGPRKTGRGGDGDPLVAKPGFLEDPKRGYKSPRAFLLDVIAMGQGRKPSEQLRSLLVPVSAVGSDEQAGYADAYGAALVPEGYSPNLLSTPSEADPLAGRTTSVPMASPDVSWPARVDKNHQDSVSGGLTVSRKQETGDIASSRMQFERVRLQADGLFGLAYATEEILTDSPISFAQLLEVGFRDEFAARLLFERLYGSGVGEFLGVLKAPCLVTQAAEGGQAADTVKYANIIKMRSRCWRYGEAVWLFNHDVLPQLMAMADDDGRLIWQNSAREGEPSMLLGRPAFASEFLPTLGDVGDILLGTWSQFLEGTYQPLERAESIHVRFVQHERAFKFWLRNAGAPWWRTALTPKKGANTLSPFVALAAR